MTRCYFNEPTNGVSGGPTKLLTDRKPAATVV